MPRAFCTCTGCTACTGRGPHLYDKADAPGKRCPACQAIATARRDARAPTAARGYGAAHQRRRRDEIAAFRPGQPCARCGQPIARAEDADLGHNDGQDGYRGLEHARCNRATNKRKRPRP